MRLAKGKHSKKIAPTNPVADTSVSYETNAPTQAAEHVKFRALVDNNSDFIAMVGLDGMIQYLNRSARQMIGEPVVGSTDIGELEQVLTPQSWRRYKKSVLPTIQSADYWHGELACWNLTTKQATPLDSTLFVVHDPATNDPLCYAVILRDNSQRKQLDDQIRSQIEIISQAKNEIERKHSELLQLNAELEKVNHGLVQLAATDSLTGLNNRHAFELRIVEETARCTRFGKPCSVLLLDVDHFKLFNDSFGHLDGDQVLREVASVLQSEARAVDFVARYGGEEFVFIFPETDADEAVIAAERVRAAVCRREWPVRPITISGGVSTWGADAPTGWHLVSKADQALYYSKSAGRDRITHARDVTP